MNLQPAIAAQDLWNRLTSVGDEMQTLLKMLSKRKWKRKKLIELAETVHFMMVETEKNNSLIRRMVVVPYEKVLKGERLEEHEYFGLRALGMLPDYFKTNGLGTFSDYDVYRFLHYEDDDRRGIIETDLLWQERQLPDGTMLGLTPIAPEEVRCHCLTEEQRDFLRAHFREEYARFLP